MISNYSEELVSNGKFEWYTPKTIDINPMDCTFVDTSGDVEIRNNSMIFSTYDTGGSSYVYKDFGTDYFSCSFRMTVEIRNFDCKDNSSYLSCCAFSTVPSTAIGILGAAGKGITLSVAKVGGSVVNASIFEFLGGNYWGSQSITLDQDRAYLELIVDCDSGTYGTAIARSYDNPNRYGVFQQTTLALHAAVGYRYVLPFMSYGVPVNEWYTGEYNNLEISKLNRRGFRYD